MLRSAVAADLPTLLAIRDQAGDDALSDPAPISETGLCEMIAAGAVSAWEEDGAIVGFAAIVGVAIHLLVDPTQRSKGIGRALLADACDRVKAAGHVAARLSLPPGSAAERHYIAAGWRIAGTTVAGGTVLNRPL